MTKKKEEMVNMRVTWEEKELIESNRTVRDAWEAFYHQKGRSSDAPPCRCRSAVKQ